MASKNELLQRRRELLLKRREILVNKKQAPVPKEKSGLDKFVEFGQKLGEKQDKLGEKIAPAVDLAIESLPAFQRIPAKAGLKTIGGVEKGFDFAGEKTTEGLTKLGVGPGKSATAGTVVSMIPDIAMAALPAIKGAKLLRISKKVLPKEALLSARTRKIFLPSKALAKQKVLQKLGKEAGEALGKAERNARIFVERFSEPELANISNPQKFRQFGKSVQDRISGRQIPTPQEAQRLQKLIGEGLDDTSVGGQLTGPDKAAIRSTRADLKKLIDEKFTGVKSARERFRDVKQLEKELPDITKSERLAINRQLEQARQGVEAADSSGVGGFVRNAIIRSLLPRIR